MLAVELRSQIRQHLGRDRIHTRRRIARLRQPTLLIALCTRCSVSIAFHAAMRSTILGYGTNGGTPLVV